MSRQQSGSILIQVLGLVAFASAIAVTMQVVQDRSIGVTTKLRDRAQAEALARSGETSVLVAFRRDGVNAPDTDHYGEEWYTRAQDTVELTTGSFSISIRDAQARYNLNRLGSGLSESSQFERIAAAAGLEPGAGARITAGVIATGQLERLQEIAAFGFSQDEIARLSEVVTVLPGTAGVNVNTASPLLITAIMANAGLSSRLISHRDQTGGLDQASLGRIGVLLPPGTGITTNFLEMRVIVHVGSEKLETESLIARRKIRGEMEAYVIRRSRT